MGFLRRKYEQIKVLKQKLDVSETIKRAQYPIILAPFFGTPIPIMVRELTQAQIIACGNFSLIETFRDKIERQQNKKQFDILAAAEYAEKQHLICSKALIKPTYNEIIEMITDKSIVDAKSKIDELKEKLKETPRGEERTSLEKELDSLRVWTDLILPEDFMAVVMSYALGIDKSDIKELTSETLLRAAILAELGHNDPSDHIDGKFTAFMRDDINTRAWMILFDERQKNKKGPKHGG